MSEYQYPKIRWLKVAITSHTNYESVVCEVVFMKLKGYAKVDAKTKDLIQRLKPGDIAVLAHEDIDEVAARSLISAKVNAVINAKKSITGKYSNPGPQLISEAGIFILDNVGDQVLHTLKDMDIIQIKDEKVFKDGKIICEGSKLTSKHIKEQTIKAEEKLAETLRDFVDNTLEYAKRETSLILDDLQIPDIGCELYGKQVVVVVRGGNYQEDLKAISSYIEDESPVLIGVDGGADALLDCGYIPDIVTGDMDSVSDKALKLSHNRVVHGYPDGRAPGLSRINDLGLEASVLPAPGMSEDVALLMAFQKGAQLIVAVGPHSSMIDFLEKGRKGMGSTFLVRLKVGSLLVDAKGVSALYKSKPKGMHLLRLGIAALIPILIVLLTSEEIAQLIYVLTIRFRFFIASFLR